MWVRGLKQCKRTAYHCELAVAPYVGAWIETGGRLPARRRSPVAPYVGAWIETRLPRVP